MDLAKVRIFPCLLAVLLMMICAVPAGASSRVETVRSEVTAAHSLPPLAKARMEKSVEAIASQLLAGQELAQVEAQRVSDEALIMEVFDKVLVGYTVLGVKIQPGAETLVQVNLYPWDTAIEKVVPVITVEGMSPMVEGLVLEDAAGLGDVFSQALLGLPVAAGDWTSGLIKQEVNAYLDEHLPEFRADFDVQAGQETKAVIVLYPRLPVVRTVDLSMRSDTIPSVTLLAHRKVMEEKCQQLVGVPVGFVERHREAFEKALAKELDEKAGLSRWKIATLVELQPGERTSMQSRSNTDLYRVRLEGWLDVGHRTENYRKGDRDLVLRLHAGVMASSKDEFFTLLDLRPEKPDWGWQLGYGRSLSSKGRAEVRYDIRDSQWVLAASQQLARRWSLRYEYRWGEKLGEGALRYQLHDFMALEYVIDNDDSWMRVIGYF